jgi:O-antigen ligase
MYSALWKAGLEHPIFGVGVGERIKSMIPVHPHHNFLGIMAMMGIPAALFYFIFVVSTILTGLMLLFRMHRHQTEDNKEKAYFLFICIAIFLFQQIRGFAHDTWTLKTVYLWAGSIIGVRDYFLRTKL